MTRCKKCNIIEHFMEGIIGICWNCDYEGFETEYAKRVEETIKKLKEKRFDEISPHDDVIIQMYGEIGPWMRSTYELSIKPNFENLIGLKKR